MSTGITATILIAVALLLAIGFGSWMIATERRSKKLRQKYGAEYDYALEQMGEQRAAEESLIERGKRVDQLGIRDLNSDEALRYQADWDEVQAEFVDDPPKSIDEANQLVTEVMIVRGFPVANFEQRAADLSVLYPNFISNYRKAHDISTKNEQGVASTEELRQAMVYYHSILEELVGNIRAQPFESEEEKEVIAQ